MAVRKPLVVVNGTVGEVPAGDVVAGNVIVQQTDPGMTNRGMWWQTDGAGNLVTLWVETAGA